MTAGEVPSTAGGFHVSDPTPPRDHRTVTRLDDLVESDEFTRRHIGPSPVDLSAMLGVIGVDSVRALLDETMPAPIRSDAPLELARRGVRSCRARPTSGDRRTRIDSVTSLIGMGYTARSLPR